MDRIRQRWLLPTEWSGCGVVDCAAAPGVGRIFLAVKALERRTVRLKSPVICGSGRTRQSFSVISRHAAFFHAAADCRLISLKMNQSMYESIDNR